MHQLIQPEGWERPKGYANGIAARGTQSYVGGMVGWNAQQQFESDDFLQQTGQALRNVLAVLQAAGAGPEHMVRMTWYAKDKKEYLARGRELGKVYQEVMGKHYPAMTLMVMTRIHWQALRLWLKRVGFFSKPQTPDQFVTR